MVDCKNCKNYGNRCIPAVNGECDAFVEAKVENVDHPAHYQQEGRKECIVEMLEKFGATAVYWFSVLSAYKYRYRAGNKPDNAAEQDTAKAEWYDRKAEEMRGIGATDGWISCSERMPETTEKGLGVLYSDCSLVVSSKTGWVAMAYYLTDGEKSWWEFADAQNKPKIDWDEVTHWMPLPAPPEMT